MGNIQAGGKQFVHCPFFGGRNVWAIYRQGANSFVHCREVVHCSECPLSEVPLYRKVVH